MKENLPIAIACRLDKPNALELTRSVIEYLTKKGIKIVLETRIAPRFSSHLRKDLRQMDQDSVKLVMSIGGDGTILRIAQNLPVKNPTPILGINIGSVGFLNEIDFNSSSDSSSFYEALDKIIKGDYSLEKSMRLTSYCNHKRLQNALNEVYIVSSTPSKILHVGIKVDGEFFNNTYLDGVIISTQVGSTAHSLSAGGNIVDPRLNVIQIVPVNQFARTGGISPILVPSSSEIEIELLRTKLDALIVIDGQREYRAFSKSKIKIRKSKSSINFVRFKNFTGNFYSKLRNKLFTSAKVQREDSLEE
ncbi:MAG: NAD(+)/NADH kinase [Promethearchaeota archaeon]